MGKPKKPVDEKLSEAVLVRFSRPDMRRVKERAREEGTKPATLIREGALAHLDGDR